MGVSALGIKLDATSAEEVNASVKKIINEFGKIYIVVNNDGQASKWKFGFAQTESLLE